MKGKQPMQKRSDIACCLLPVACCLLVSACNHSATGMNPDGGVDMNGAPKSLFDLTQLPNGGAAMGSDFFAFDQPFEMPGRSCFLQVDGRVFLTYAQFARGLESTGGSYYFLDLTALGRQEDWERPAGRTANARANQPDFST